MRLAGSQEVLSALARRFAADEAGQQAKTDSELDAFFRAYELLKSKGYAEGTASDLAIEIAKGNEQMPNATRRFAGIYDDPS